MNKQELDAIRERCEKATQGPWHVDHKHPNVWVRHEGVGCPIAATYHNDDEALYNARFIAIARTDIPALLAEIDRLQAERNAEEQLKLALINDTPQLGACVTCKQWKQKTVRKKLVWYCKYDEGIDKEADTGWCSDNDQWEWRGLEGRG